MSCIAGNDRNEPRPYGFGHPINGQLQFALNHFVHFFLWMEVLVNRRASFKIVVRESHTRRVEVAPIPARQAFGDFQFADVNNWHEQPARLANMLAIILIALSRVRDYKEP